LREREIKEKYEFLEVPLINSLGSYVEETVKRISENQQKPVSLIPDGFRNFVISIVE